jgi:HK97 family phage portal protein
MSLRDDPHPYEWLASIDRGDDTARGASAVGAGAAVAMGSIGYGAGGPTWGDQWRTKRSPVPSELVEQYKAVAYACVRLNATGVARVPLRLYCKTGPADRPARRDTSPVAPRQEKYLRSLPHVRASVARDDDVDEVREHPFLDALQKPCPEFDGQQFLEYLTACLDVVGSAYFQPIRPDPSYAASQWWPLQAQYVMPVKATGDPDRVLREYTFFGQTIPADQLERIREISLRDPYLSGYAPMQACYEQSGLTNYYTAAVEDILRSGNRPSGMVSAKDGEYTMNADQVKRARADFTKHFARGNSGGLMFVEGAYQYTPLSWSPTDLGGLEITKTQRLVMANCFDVPISLLQAEDSNRAVAEAGNYQHQRNGIEPRCKRIAGCLTSMARAVDPRLFFGFDNAVEEDIERRSKVVDMQVKSGLRTINQINAEDGIDPVPYGDEPWLDSKLVQPSEAARRQAVTETAAATAAEALANKPAMPEEPGTEEEPSKPDPAADAERSLMRRLDRTLRRIDEGLQGADFDPVGPVRRGARGLDPAGGGGRRGEPEHVWTADGAADRPPAPGVLPAAGGGDGRAPADDGHGIAGVDADPHLVGSPDGGGDDAAAVDVLGPIGEGSDGTPGAGSGLVVGGEPPHGGDDPLVEPVVLRGDEPDDVAKPQ